eukprot:TRINITY_DN21138_c0_g1_i1.p2 TRINITY_DN21138_c0_g1~~TRINITY_DN21138_c0_g1_i1.p2  ORF type:complete len:405 (+),score=170.18 TRINITY_DN21138_c0_g1_i1:79-1215(+)
MAAAAAQPLAKRPRTDGQYVTLASGHRMPMVGLGTWKSPLGKTGEAVKAAVRAGYRLIDTANDYNNEEEIGRALKELLDAGEVKREELFIQSKLWNANHRKDHAWADIRQTLKDLQLTYVDSYVIHWPQACPALPNGEGGAGLRTTGAFPGPSTERPNGGIWMFPLDAKGRYCSDNSSHFLETWAAMEEMVDQGLVKSIGVSNFNRAQVQEIIDHTKKHPCTVLQNECHPYFQQKDLVDYCRAHNIIFQAFSPLGSADRPTNCRRAHDPVPVLQNPTLTKIAQKHKKSIAQVVVRWHFQRGVSCVPKSITPSRVAENYKIWDFELSRDDMDAIDALNIGWRHLLWEETALHPDYPFKDDLPPGYVPGKAPLATTTAGA